ncbi:SigB/SigF/SigG family RNA polymerase sigma factor [Kineococcus sp. SYSU DK005]|uniref:SigB/SigF/SigG family RNA polymerase sigma factor n=1 Tax=Kineococcus sp. SYSU DK005 TaxID=3383126 RepID=UPI003D7DA519
MSTTGEKALQAAVAVGTTAGPRSPGDGATVPAPATGAADDRPTPQQPVHRPGSDDAVAARTAALFDELAEEEDSGERARLQQRIATLNLPMARSIARRYRGRGEDLEDLEQVAAVGLMKAIEGYDRTVGREFVVFAVPTVSGQIKRHFRDRSWSIRPPRRLQELRPRLSAARTELEQDLGRSPTVSEIAARLGVDAEEVGECMAAAEDYRLHSLDELVADAEGSSLSVLDTLGEVDAALETVVDHVTLAPLLTSLPERDARLLTLRFQEGWTQSRIGEELGVSQMQVSRLLQAVLRRLRTAMEAA